MSNTSAKGRYTQLMSWLKGFKSSPVSNFQKQQRIKNSPKKRSAR